MEFIETRLHWFSSQLMHHTNGVVNVICLIKGDEIVIESPDMSFEPFIVHYAETFIIPASVNDYTIRPSGVSLGKVCGTLKAWVRTKTYGINSTVVPFNPGDDNLITALPGLPCDWIYINSFPW